MAVSGANNASVFNLSDELSIKVNMSEKYSKCVEVRII